MTSHVVPSGSETVSITVELPKQALELLGLTTDEASVYLKTLALIELFRRGEVSSGWAAEKLGSFSCWLGFTATSSSRLLSGMKSRAAVSVPSN